MKDFLNDLADQEEIKRNPFKAFATYTALKFEDNDKKCKELTESVDDLDKSNAKKLDEKDFNTFLRDYDKYKATMTTYVVIGTILINGLLWMIGEVLQILKR